MTKHKFDRSQLPWYWREVTSRIAKSSIGPKIRQLTNDRRMLPSFIIVGAQKAGTTFLHRVLSEHPQVREPWRKEMHFFDINYQRGLGWYRAYFPHREPGAITGEGSPSYMFHPRAPERIAKHLPGVKLIVVLREPASRALSHYKMALWRGSEELSFREALAREDERIASELEKIQADPNYGGAKYLRYSYRARGLYLDQIRRLESHFSRDDILVLDDKSLFRDTGAVLGAVEKFLGIDPWQPGEVKPEAVAKTDYEPEAGVMEELREFYRPHDEALFQHLGWEPRW
jgi:hypothetical protein